MSRIVVFTETGFILWDKNQPDGAGVPDLVLNKFVTAVLIEDSLDNQNPVVVDNHDVYFSRDRASGSIAAVLTSRLTTSRPSPQVADDILKILKSVKGSEQTITSDFAIEKFDQLVQLSLNAEKNLDSDADANYQPDLNEEPSAISQTPAEIETVPTQGSKASQSVKSKQSKPSKDQKKKPKNQKVLRKWDGLDNEVGDEEELDFSEQISTDPVGDLTRATEAISLGDYGSKSKNGFEVKALSDELDGILFAQDSAEKKDSNFGFLRSLMGGKTLTEDDLKKSIDAMEKHLINKNVAQEVAAHLADKVRQALIGSRTKTWTSVQSMVRYTMTETLQSILTPKTSVDLLLEIRKNRKTKKRPYVISVVGVNGVGKSTNLGKLGFWLLQNDFKILVAACDTFRSGAVEQLRVHVDRLSQLSKQGGAGSVELFSQGYGKDAAVIAQKAVEFGEKNGFDIVLIDTAGRRHNDERLMSSLEKFGKLAEPDKIIMVGEALVGTDSVQQAKNFDAAFGPKRHLDFFLVSKVDTVGDMLGTLVNMTFSTGVPVLFMGVGQTYTDLRTLSVDWAVTKLLA